jgi:dephospho-CoA kinase
MNLSRTPQRKPIIGLVGGIGSGKSLVARQMAGLGCGVIDADQLARAALEQDPAIRTKLVQWWGPKVLKADGQIDRAAVGRIVFDQPHERRRLEDLLHPMVYAGRQRLRARFESDPSILAIVEDTPLLMEKGLDRQCDVIIFVSAPTPQRLQRLALSRGWTAEELARREKTQLPLDIKARRADYVVENSAGEDECLRHVRRVLSQILRDHP